MNSKQRRKRNRRDATYRAGKQTLAIQSSLETEIARLKACCADREKLCERLWEAEASAAMTTERHFRMLAELDESKAANEQLRAAYDLLETRFENTCREADYKRRQADEHIAGLEHLLVISGVRKAELELAKAEHDSKSLRKRLYARGKKLDEAAATEKNLRAEIASLREQLAQHRQEATPRMLSGRKVAEDLKATVDRAIEQIADLGPVVAR